MITKLTHAGYFEGIGGFSLGAERVGIETIYTCEWDDFRYDWLQYRFPNATHEKDIREATGMYADIFTAGFPCQDISASNPRGKGLHGERSGLFFDFMQLVRIHRPRYVVLENSPNVISKGYLLDILREFATIGYNAEWQVISKRIFGYPDERERFFLVAYCSKIGCKESSRIFNKTSFSKSIKQTKNEMEEYQPGRRDSIQVWKTFISDTLSEDTGFPRELAAKEIAAYGDAVCPDVAQLIFKMIKEFELCVHP